MSYIPNTREKFKYNFKTGKYDGQENGYRQEYLNDRDKEFVKGFDYAVNTIMNYFRNLDVFSEEFLKAGINTHRIDTEAVVADDMSDEEIEALDEKTYLLGTVHDSMSDWLEMERNELIVSCLDNMSGASYEKNRKRVLGEENR